MDLKLNKRDTTAPIIWEGDLNDDCLARWAGLLLRAEWMQEDIWWWCVYDMLNDEFIVDTSNNYETRPKSGKTARELAEKAARNYFNLFTFRAIQPPDET